MYSGSEGRSSNNTSNSTSNGYSTLDDGILRVYQGGGGEGREDASPAGNELRFQVIPHLSYDDVTCSLAQFAKYKTKTHSHHSHKNDTYGLHSEDQ